MYQDHDINHPFKSMIDNMSEGFIYYKAVIDSLGNLINYKVIETNKSFELTLGVSKSQLSGKDFSEIALLNENTSIYFNCLLQKMHSLDNTPFEVQNPRTGKVHSFSVFCEDDGCFTALFRDVSELKCLEAAIHDNEKYKYHFNLSSDMLFIKNFKNDSIELNPAWSINLGYNDEELESRISWDLIHPDDLDKTISEYKCLLKGNTIVDLENRFLCKDNDYKWLQWNAFPDMEKGLIYAVVRDITRQKKMEEQLRQNEERLSFAMEGSGSGVWDWNMQTNESIYSKTWKSMLGYEEVEITSTPDEWHSRIHPDDIDIVDTEHSKYFNGETSNYACEYRMRCKNGEYKWVLSSGKIMQWDKNGKPLRMTGIHTDITELKNLIEEYKKITLDYQIIFNGTQDAMFLVSADKNERLRFIRLNEIHEKLTGFTTEMVAGLTPPEVLGEDLGNIVENNYLHCYKEKRPIQYEEVMILPTGEKVWQTLLSPVIRDGKVAYIVGSSRDITEQRNMEELKRNADKKIEQLKESIAHENLKNEFFANLSHELRTPLNVIFASIQVVNLKLNECTDPALRNSLSKYLKSMKQNCFRLIRLVNNLIDITRIDAGYFGLSLENQNIVSVVEDITLSVAGYMENKSISLIFDTEIEEMVMAVDPDKIERIMLNLLSNAVKFTNPGGEIMVNLYERDEKLCISVKDSGIGIPGDKLGVIFDRFTQVDKSLTRSREGSGIGLALVKSLVQLHDGCISVNSVEGEGSEFLIELPAKLIPKNQNPYHDENKVENSIIERIHIEFSDIYTF